MSVSHLILFFKQKTAYECRCSDWSSDVCSSELVDVTVLEDKLSRIVRNWQDDLREELVAAEGEERGLKLANRYGRALPTGYIEQVTPEIAARDVLCLASLADAGDLRVNLYRPRRGEGGLRLKFYRLDSTEKRTVGK